MAIFERKALYDELKEIKKREREKYEEKKNDITSSSSTSNRRIKPRKSAKRR